MQFGKLFQMLVVSGAAMGLSSGCSTPAQAQQQQGRDARTDTTDKDAAPDAGMAKAQDPDAGTSSGGGVSGW